VNTFKRSKLSKHIEEVSYYTKDLERISMLRDKCFKMWTTDANGKSRDHYEQEWKQYNTVLEVMLKTLEVISTMEQPKPRRAK